MAWAQEPVMGYNRSGKARKDRLKRHKKEQLRLASKGTKAKAATPGK
jgi:hypothetical protein